MMTLLLAAFSPMASGMYGRGSGLSSSSPPPVRLGRDAQAQ